MKKSLLALLIIIMGASISKAQQDPQFTHNMFDKLSVNPGYAGMDDMLNVTGIYRTQWTGFSGVNTPETILLNAHLPVLKETSFHGGAGITVYNDELGAEKNNLIRLSYSYHMTLGSGKLGGGINIGYFNKELSQDWKANDPHTQDIAIPNSGITSSVFDVSLGLYYKTNKLHMGISSTHLAESDFEFSGGSGAQQFDLGLKKQRHYYVMAGYKYFIGGDRKYQLHPFIFAKSDAASTQIDLNANFLYDEKAWIGFSYRPDDAISPMIGYQYEKGNYKLKAGYSYDLTTSELNTYSNGSHEVMLQVLYNIVKPPPDREYHNVRFL
ncbi:MAG: type IX secretion system membrane protein PorP/SprF [Flavobacteriales bacterium]